MFDRYFIAVCIHSLMTTYLLSILYKYFSIFACMFSRISFFFLYSFIIYITFGITKKYLCGGKIRPKNKAVLITGCDSGFGFELAKRLDSKGFKVFAACLFPQGKGAADLKNSCSENLRVLHIDVRDDECVEHALNFVKESLGTSELWAVVNNAGIFKDFTIELTPLDAFRDHLEVNSLGVVRVTKAFLPFLKKSRGRVINVTSLAGRTTSKGIAGYAMSKHASVAFTECLSLEMKRCGVRAISIEPEIFRTPIHNTYNKGMDQEFAKVSQEIKEQYGEDYLEKFKNVSLTSFKIASARIDLVIDDMESAVMDEYPNHVYSPRRNFIVRILFYIFESLPYTLREHINVTIVDFLGYPNPKRKRERRRIDIYKKN